MYWRDVGASVGHFAGSNLALQISGCMGNIALSMMLSDSCFIVLAQEVLCPFARSATESVKRIRWITQLEFRSGQEETIDVLLRLGGLNHSFWAKFP